MRICCEDSLRKGHVFGVHISQPGAAEGLVGSETLVGVEGEHMVEKVDGQSGETATNEVSINAKMSVQVKNCDVTYNANSSRNRRLYTRFGFMVWKWGRLRTLGHTVWQGEPQILLMQSSWVSSRSPWKSGFFVKSSAKMHLESSGFSWPGCFTTKRPNDSNYIVLKNISGQSV